MQIVDGKSDYYDYAGYGIDANVVLDRRESLHAGSRGVDGYIQTMSAPVEIHEYEFEWMSEIDSDYDTFVIRTAYVAIGGMGFPTVQIGDLYHYERGEDFAYAADDVRARISGILDRLPSDRRTALRKQARALLDQSAAFVGSDPKDLSPLCGPAGLITGLVWNDTGQHSLAAYGQGTRWDQPRIIFEPRLLRHTGVDAIVPAHEAHMMVSQFVSGVLNAPERVELSDMSRIVKAGFDPQTSFRHRQTTSAGMSL